MARRKYSKKMKSSRKKAWKKPSLKRQLLRMHETKEASYQANITLLHQSSYAWCPTQTVLVGNNSNTRIGDDVYLTSLVMNGFFATDAAAHACHKFRCIVFWSRAEVACGAFAQNVIGGSQVWHPGTDAIIANAIPNPNACTVVSDFVIDAAQVLNTAKEFKSFNITVPLKQTFKYREVNGVYGKSKNLYVLVNSFIAGGVDNTTSAGTLTLAATLKFKDP